MDEDVQRLAATLKAQGIAASETRALEMAEEILRTERKQTQSYDDRRYDPALNPQQRTSVVHDEKPATVQKASIGAEVPEDVPIAELLREDIAPEPQQVPDVPEAEEIPEPETEIVEQEPERLEPPEGAPETEELMRPAAPFKDDDTAETQDSHDTAEEAKVDLNEMFNFGKRRG